MAEKETALSATQIEERLRELPEWSYEGGAIRRVYETAGWPITLMLVNAIGFCAEAADHHPDLSVKYRSVAVALSTHSAKGITGKDFVLARRFDEVAMWPPGETALVKGS